MPVLDRPMHLQLHASLDIFSCVPFSLASEQTPSDSAIFWLDRETISQALNHTLMKSPPEDDVRSRRIKDILEEGWDLFLRTLADGSIVVTAVAVSSQYRPNSIRSSPP